MRRVAMMAAGLLLGAVFASAQPLPSVMHYQGRLLDEDAAPLPDGDYLLKLNLYTEATDGSLAWGPQIFGGGSEVPVVNGYFNLMLGPQDETARPLAEAFGAAARYLEVTADVGGGDVVIAPRQRILSVPYALRTKREVPFGTIMHFAGAQERIPAGWLPCKGQSLDWSTDYPRLRDAIGTRWGGTEGVDYKLPDSRDMYQGGAAPESGLSPPLIESAMGPHSHGLHGHKHDSGSLYAEIAANRATDTVYSSNAAGSFTYDTYLSSISILTLMISMPPYTFYEDQGVSVGGNTSTASGSDDETGTTATIAIGTPIPVNAHIWYIIKAE